MTALEYLARRICWLEFGDPSKVGGTMADYWNGLSQEKRDEYILGARYWAFMSKKIKLTMLLAAQRELGK